MKQLKLFFALFAMLALGVGNAWGENAPVNTVLWGENFAHFGTKTPSNAKTGTGTTIYDGASITYTQSSTNTKAYNEKLAGGTAPELLLSKSNQTWTISGIKTGGATKMSLTFLSNKTTFSVTVSSTSLSVSGEKKSWTITLKDGQTVPETFDLTIKNTGSSNARIDNVELKVTVAGTNTEPVTTYSVTLNKPANGTISATGLTDGKAAEGTIVKLTATPDAGYKWESWTVTGASGDVDVSNNQFTMPAEDVTVTASFVAKTQYTIKWNVAEGSVEDTKVYEGDALSTLPDAPNCSEGKVFVGWTAATTVNPDGSGITYVKATDVPDGNKVYNAVYAVQEIGSGESGSADVTLSDGVFDSTNKTITWTVDNYATIFQVKGSSQTDVANYTSAPRWYVGHNVTFTPQSGVNITKIVINQGTDTKYQEFANATITNADIAVDGSTVTLTPKNGSDPVVIVPTKQLRPTAITIHKGAAISYTDYSLDCDTHQDPYLTLLETEINFGTVAQDATVTETLNVSGGYLAEDVTLTISGTNASFFSVNPTTIAKADEVDQDVTITYNPTATGDHTATLTIKSGEITKTVALSGTVLAPGQWALVTDASQLNLGDEIIIVAADANVALSTTQNTNNRGQAKIVKVGNTVNAGDDVQILTLGQGTVENTFAFSTGDGYLYAAGTNSSNHLKTNTTLDARGSWAITIDNATGVATIKAQDSSTKRNWLRYNATNNPPIFSCYESGQKDVCVYRNTDVIVAPIISGNVDFTTETLVTITAQRGLTVYYTTDGSTPDKTATQYSAPFTISATTTVKAIAYDATEKASNVAEKTFTKHELVNVATAMALEKDKIAYFDEFEVVKVVAGKGNIYIKDASGHGLIYDFTLAGQLKDGDRVKGFVGISSPYSGLPEAKPYNVTYEDLTITAGTAAQPYDFTSIIIAETDVNKYIVFQNVEITENTDMSTNPTLTIGGNSVNFYNQFGVSKTLEAGKIYDIYGFVAIKDGKLDVYFYEAAQDGEVIQKYTVIYNAGGATGTVPVDNAEYSEGAQVYLKSATDLTYEGYEYKGWKVTDESGNEIAVSSNRFNMPASNVTVTAQWEAIVVTPKEDFSAGLWVLVTDASELAANDYIIVAAAEENFAMKSYESGNNCKQVAITKFGNNNCFLTWTEEIGVFQLLASGSNYTIQDVNTKQYLYAAGSGTSNQLKANNNIATDENASKYVWTIVVDENGIATVKATSENRNWLRYNTNSGSDLFSCYGSGQQDIVLYKYVTDFYTRDVVTGNLGTICLPYASSKHAGATFYEIAYLEMNGTDPNRIYLDEVEGGVLEAGKPYIFQATSNKVTVAYEGEASSLKEGVKGLVGILEDSKVVNGQEGVSNILTGNYVISGTKFYTCGTGCSIYKNRAYIDASIIANHTTPIAEMPGRRRIAMGAAGENQATGVDNTLAPKDNVVKVIENGQLIIIRDGVKYNVQGQKL